MDASHIRKRLRPIDTIASASFFTAVLAACTAIAASLCAIAFPSADDTGRGAALVDSETTELELSGRGRTSMNLSSSLRSRAMIS